MPNDAPKGKSALAKAKSTQGATRGRATKAVARSTGARDDITTMRVRRATLAKLSARQRELGAASLDEALETILFRQRSYEAILRLKADPQELADYQSEAREWAEGDIEGRG